MAYYRQLGDVPHTRHTLFHGNDGNVAYEELMGEEGFSSDSALLYHRYIPAALVNAVAWELPDQSLIKSTPFVPRHLKLHDLFTDEQAANTDAVTGRRLVLGNGDVRISYAMVGKTSPLYRNNTGDECVYVEDGSASVETVFGAIELAKGDYIIIPQATTHRWVIDEGTNARLYFVEANSHIGPAAQYLSKYGQLLERSPYCERDLRGPVGPLLVDEADVDVYVKHDGDGPTGLAGTIQSLPHHPFDVIGWDGCLYPYAFNIKDYMPITGKVHQPPPAHQVFEGHNFVLCNFVPRKVDYHPLSVPVPYYHSNVDSDEIMFYVDGDYEARKGSGIDKGSISIHPGGYTHGPQPGAVEASVGLEYFDELAVMVDTFVSLSLGEAGRAVDDGKYASSWSGGRWLSGEHAG